MRRGRPPHDDILTPREWEVAALLRRGMTNEQIAEALGISFGGAKYHVAQILSKLQAGSREEAVIRLDTLDRRETHRGLAPVLWGWLRRPVLAPAALLAIAVVVLSLAYLTGGDGEQAEPGLLLLTPDRQVDIPALEVKLDERYDPAEFDSLVPLLQRSYDSTCEPHCRQEDIAGVSLIRPSDGSIAADVRVHGGGLLAVTRPSRGELLVATGYDEDASLLVLDAANGFELARTHAIPHRGSHRVFLGTDFVLSRDERYLYLRTETNQSTPGCSPYYESYHCIDVLDLDLGELRRVRLEPGCGNVVHAEGDSDAIIVCGNVILHAGPRGEVYQVEPFVYWEQPHTGSAPSWSNYYAWRLKDGRLAVLSSQGVLSYREKDGTGVHRPLLPEGLRLQGLGPPFNLDDGRVLFGVTSVPITGLYDPALGKAAVFDPATLTMTLPFDFGEASYVAPVPHSDDLAVLRYDGSIDLVSPGGATRQLLPPKSRGSNDLVLVK